jgi:hypothetical protein
LISEDHFVHFADAHERKKKYKYKDDKDKDKDKDKVFVVEKFPKTANPQEVQAFNNVRRLGYRVETI